MLLSTSKSGFLDGLVKAGKIILWHLAANGIVLLITVLSSVRVDASDEKYAIYAGAIALTNAILAGVGKWLKTVEPAGTDIIPAYSPESNQRMQVQTVATIQSVPTNRVLVEAPASESTPNTSTEQPAG